MDLRGKTVMVTGASRGIGAETALLIAEAGANVVLMARSGKAINDLATKIGPKAMAITCDVSDYAQVQSAVDRCVDAFGTVDIFIGNAGVIEPISHMAEADPENWGRVIDINLKGVFYGMRAVLPIMKASGGGTIITVSSGAAINPMEAWSHYCASKAGALMLTRNLHLEEAANGIRCLGLSPGTVATQMQRDIKASGINPVADLDWEDHIPADWAAKTLLWMCGPEADAYLGADISLRKPEVRAAVGLE